MVGTKLSSAVSKLPQTEHTQRRRMNKQGLSDVAAIMILVGACVPLQVTQDKTAFLDPNEGFTCNFSSKKTISLWTTFCDRGKTKGCLRRWICDIRPCSWIVSLFACFHKCWSVGRKLLLSLNFLFQELSLAGFEAIHAIRHSRSLRDQAQLSGMPICFSVSCMPSIFHQLVVSTQMRWTQISVLQVRGTLDFLIGSLAWVTAVANVERQCWQLSV